MKPNKIYVLGDSLSDTGVLIGGGNAFLKCLAIPKTIIMKAPFYQNCFTNGKVAVTIIADYFSIPLIPAWKFNILGINNEQNGNNYATSGAVINSTNDFTVQSWLMKYFDFNHQVAALTSQHQFIKNDIIFIMIGSNDILNAIKKNSKVEQVAIIKQALLTLQIGLEKLINHGAKLIIVGNIPNISKAPLFKNNDVVQTTILWLINTFNHALLLLIQKLNGTKQIIIHYNLFENMIRAINEFKKLDINNNITDAAFITNFSQMIINGVITAHFNAGVTLETMDKYFFFDDIHPNQWAHNFLAQSLITMIEKIKNS